MNIQGILVVKDEADVVGDVLRSAHRWASRINVLDNGSTDGTWDVLQACAKDLPRVNLLGTTSEPFRDRMRADVFQEVRASAGATDWWVRLDADEFHMVDPRSVLAALPRWYDAVQGSMYQFLLTDLDAEEIDADLEGWADRPLPERVRWYRNDWSELRFVRDSTTARWTDTPWPEGTHRIAPASVPIRHYQYRHPAQVSRRIAGRSQLAEFVHEQHRTADTRSAESWRQVLVPHDELDHDDGYAPLVARHDPVPALTTRLRRQAGWLARKATSVGVRRRPTQASRG